MNKHWKPPFYLYAVGRGSASAQTYYNDTSKTPAPRRLLFKYTVSGEGVLYVKEKRRVIKSDDLFIIERPGPYIYCYEADGEAWRFNFASIAFTSPSGILPEKLQKNPVIDCSHHPELKFMLDELIENKLAATFNPDGLLDSALAYRFLLSCVKTVSEQSADLNPAAEKLRKILTEKFNSEINLKDECKKLSYTQEALSRAFKKSFDIAPGAYLQKLRLNESIRLLHGSCLSIKEISLKCGFNSQNYFSRTFKRNFSLTPKEYRKNPDPLLTEH